MHPAAITILDTLPLTTNGKINRKALPTPEYTAISSTQTLRPGAMSALEEKLCATFGEVLGRDPVGVDDDFFALGGHSLLAVRLTTVLKERGVSVTVRDLLSAPSVRGLMNRMTLASVRDSFDVLLPIRTQGSEPPLFCVHPGGGLSWCYMPLARHVPAEVPLYGLQAPGLDGTGALAQSVHQMAALYVEQMRAIQPTGPYHLLGWSFGGIPAHEIAVQLQDAGEEVATLILMDAFPRDLVSGDEGDAPDPDAELARLVDWFRKEAGDALGAISEDELQRLARVYQQNSAIGRAHRLGHFGGEALLVVADEGKDRENRTGERWHPYIGGTVSEARIPCTHIDMARPDMLGEVWAAVTRWREGKR